jgi:hypothetical protein
VRTVTSYRAPFCRAVPKAKAPLPTIERSLPPLSRSTRPVPARPVTAPPIVKPLEQATSTSLASPPRIVPVELRTTQFCPLGCVRTTTA